MISRHLASHPPIHPHIKSREDQALAMAYAPVLKDRSRLNTACLVAAS